MCGVNWCGIGAKRDGKDGDVGGCGEEVCGLGGVLGGGGWGMCGYGVDVGGCVWICVDMVWMCVGVCGCVWMCMLLTELCRVLFQGLTCSRQYRGHVTCMSRLR